MDTPTLNGVARTLLVPLACRAGESIRPDALLHDPHAVALLKNFEGTDCLMKMSALDQTFTVMRARQFDRYACVFVETHPAGLVVDIGCGLDTRFYRMDNGQMSWLGVDLPEVIALRRQFLPDTARCQTLPCSMFDPGWIEIAEQLDKPAIFLAEGVFPYFHEAQVKPIITTLAGRFPGSEIVFDALSTFSAWLHNHSFEVLKETGTRLNWGIDDPKVLEAWGLHLLGRWSYFEDREPRIGTANMLRHIPILDRMNTILHYSLAG